MKLVIVYNLTKNPTLNYYLPTAYLCSTDKTSHTLKYIVARAVPETIKSYAVAWQDTPHAPLSDLISSVSEESIVDYMTRRGGKRKSLSKLCEDKQTKALILKYVDKKMAAILSEIRLHNFPLCLDGKKKDILEQHRIQHASARLQPLLSFHKTNNGITYSLTLREQEQQHIIRCSKHQVHICVTNPSMIIVDQILYDVDTVDSNKLKPFLSKDTIIIPQEKVGVYFEKFIMPMVQVVDIETKGFEVAKDSDLQEVSLHLSKDFINDVFVLDLRFRYTGTTFSYADPSQTKTKLAMDAQGNINISQVVRSSAEQQYADMIGELGLLSLPSKRWCTLEKSKYSIVEWLIAHQTQLIDRGIALSGIEIGGRPLVLQEATLAVTTSQENDWFDVKGTVYVGGYEIPFADFIQNIAKEDPIYKLPDGSLWIIPDTWMSKYSKLPRYAEHSNGRLKVNVANHALLAEIADVDEQEATPIEAVTVKYEDDPALRATLRPYQRQGVEWLLSHQANDLGACLADDMGLGKTLQTLAVLNYTKDQIKTTQAKYSTDKQLDLFASASAVVKSPLRALIVLPASLVFNWRSEIRKFTPHLLVSEYVGSGRSAKAQFLSQYDIVLTTYQSALRDIDVLGSIEWRYIILDESQVIKNKNSKVFQAITSLSTEHKISLSGTPIENSLADLWSQMQFINPGMLGSYEAFKSKFKIPIEKNKDQVLMQLLRDMVQPYILRRRKEEVAADLPPLHRQLDYIPMDTDQQKRYDKVKSAARNHLLQLDESEGTYQAHVFASLLQLRQIANHPVLVEPDYEGLSGKLQRVKAQLAEIYQAGNKVLVFSAFKSHLDLVGKHLTKHGKTYCMLTGDTPLDQRAEQVRLFESSSDHNAFLISLKAGGVGLNLTRANYVFILDPWWNPAAEEQAIARAHRIGQKQPVTVIKFISKDTLEEKIVKLQAKKAVLAAEIIESDAVFELTKDTLMSLLE